VASSYLPFSEPLDLEKEGILLVNLLLSLPAPRFTLLLVLETENFKNLHFLLS
jgi:hypothetical protein